MRYLASGGSAIGTIASVLNAQRNGVRSRENQPARAAIINKAIGTDSPASISRHPHPHSPFPISLHALETDCFAMISPSRVTLSPSLAKSKSWVIIHVPTDVPQVFQKNLLDVTPYKH